MCSAKLAIASLISNKRKWNNNIVLLNFLKSKNLKYEIRAKKARKSERNKKKKLNDDAMCVNTLWSDRRRLITKNINFLAFSCTSKRRH